MKNLITTTFTTEQEPSYAALAKHFMHDVGFFDLDIDKYDGILDDESEIIWKK